MKRPLLIIAAVIVLIGLIFGAYYLFSDDATLVVGDPFGGLGSGNIIPGQDLPTDGVETNAGEDLAPRFVKVTDGPVAAGTVAFGIQIPIENTQTVSVGITGTSTELTPTTEPDVEVRFIDRASGNVYAYVAHERTLSRISNRTLPGVQEASWVADGSRAYVRFLTSSAGTEHIDTYALNANGEGGYLLEQNLDQVSVAGTSTLMTLFSGSTGSVATISRADGSAGSTLFSSLISSLVVQPTNGAFYAHNKASAFIDGYGFQINRTTGAFTRILGPLRGLTLLPNPSGTSLVYSYSEGGVFRLRLLDIGSRTSTALPVATLTEKCVWAANGLSVYCAVPTGMQGVLPDYWYQGAVGFTDRIWKIDIAERVATLVVDPGEVAGISVDAIALTVDPTEDILVFSDKSTGALYVYDL